jgi:Flp pilus assembly protein TadB
MDLVQTSPQFLSAVRNSEDAILANASATGGLRGGNVQDALSENRADRFALELDRQLAQLAGAAGLGSGATDSVSAFGANKAENVGQLYNLMGQTRARGISLRGGINAQNWANAGNAVEDAIKAIFGGGG